MAPLDARAEFLIKRDIALRLMAGKGIGSWRSAQPIYHAFWACGLRIRPPMFAGFLFNFTHHALMGGLFFGFSAFILDLAGRLDGISRPIIIAAVVVGAMLLGLMAALEFRYFARKYNLPPWSELKDEAQVFE
jgi:hypothetical protein